MLKSMIKKGKRKEKDSSYLLLAYENPFFREIFMKIWMEYLFNGQKKTYFCATLSVRVSILFVGVRESWSWVHDENLNKGHKQFDKA